MAKKRVAVLFGGVSSEHEISRVSGVNVIANLPKEKYDVVQIGITKQGKWLLYDGPAEKIANGEWEQDENNCTAFISPDSSCQAIIKMKDDSCELVPVDIIFPVLHGKNGEDGTIQGLFQLSGIPFVGCDTLSSAACMDKAVTNIILDSANIAQAEYIWFYACDFDKNETQILNDIDDKLLGYPVFVKPANAGSSVGISKVRNKSELAKAVKIASEEDKKIVIEQGIVGFEVECAVMGNENPIASVVGEILPANEFYDYEAKYQNADSQTLIPARISDEKQEEIRETAVRAYRCLGCEGLSRVDFFVRESDGKVLLNEINTLPGFTSISMYPKMFEACGISYSDLLDKLIDYGFERAGKQ